MDNRVDIGNALGYNQDNAINVVAENYLTKPQIVKMDEQKPIHDTECKHETLVADPDDTLGDAVYHGCANYKCGVGFYIQKQKP